MKNGIVMIAALTLALLVVDSAPAQGLPPAKWWKKPEVVQQLNITSAQQQQLDGIFRTSAAQLIDIDAEVKKRSLDLRGAIDQQELDKATIQRAASRLHEARGRLFERELMMLVEMRAVLSDEQWNGYRQLLASRPDGPPRGRQQDNRGGRGQRGGPRRRP